MTYRIGIDVGGTFTDFTISNAVTGTNLYFKLSSTPADPSVAIVDGIAQVLRLHDIEPGEVSYIGHGTTVATNMIIEGRGVPTALVTTKGFRDVLAIGRQTRPALYDTSIRKPEPLVERYRRREVDERLNAKGECLRPLDDGELASVLDELAQTGIKSVAVSFLHAYRNPAHEEAAARVIARHLPGIYVSLSSKVLPEFREYERTSTTVLNAYVGPKMADYFDRLDGKITELGIPVSPLTIHSNGGLLSIETAKRLPVATCLSGPAAGVMGAAVVRRPARAAGFVVPARRRHVVSGPPRARPGRRRGRTRRARVRRPLRHHPAPRPPHGTGVVGGSRVRGRSGIRTPGAGVRRARRFGCVRPSRRHGSGGRYGQASRARGPG